MTERRRVLIVGTGSIGERHLRCFQCTGRAEVAICDVDGARAREVASRYAVAGVFTDLERALETKPDAAVVCTPADLHVDIARQLVRCGIDVLIEKPLSTSLDRVEELRREVASEKVHAAVAYVWRAHPALASMRSAVVSGRFGRPLEVVAVCGQHFPTYRPAYREIYYADRSRGGGAIQDALTHLVNSIEWIVGPADEVVADAARLRLEGVSVEDTAHALARHGDVLASYSLNQHQAPNELTITVVCEGGTCRFEAHERRWRSVGRPDQPWTVELEGDWERDTPFERQAINFLDVLDDRDEPLCSLEDGLQTLRVNLALLRSADETRAFTAVR